MPCAWVCLCGLGLRHVMGSSRSQQGALGDTLPEAHRGVNTSCRTPPSAPQPQEPLSLIPIGDPAPPSVASQMGGPTTHLSPFDSGGKLCLTAATSSATVLSRVKITALGPASNVYATWNPGGIVTICTVALPGSDPLTSGRQPFGP